MNRAVKQCGCIPAQPDQAGLRTICLTVGTAGHIDHGKTQLTIFLTGCNTDRLPEEKARGMTIDLGFATCTLPNDRRIGIVDVPGHEKFVHNMVAGATGIDFVLLVVAADDGVMPQTIEHFHILRLLGIRAGMIVITKSDLAEPARISDVTAHARELVKGSFLENAPVLPLSTRTGEGFDAFYSTFVELVDKMAERNASGPFRLNIERSFVIKGLGTVVSGIPVSGAVRPGEMVDIMPAGRRVRVKGLQVYGQKADEGRAGECVALNLSDVQHTELRRGMLVCSPGFFSPARFFDIKFNSLPSLIKPLKPRTRIRMHIGTSDIPGSLVLPENEPLAPGSESFAQVQLREPIVAAPGDTLIIRTLSPITTIGGGYIVASDEQRLRRRHRDLWTHNLEQRDRSRNDLSSRILQAFPEGLETPLSLDDIARSAITKKEALEEELYSLVERGDLVSTTKGRYASRPMLEKAENILLARLALLHSETPLTAGFSKKSIYASLSTDHDLTDLALDSLIAARQVSRSAYGYYITDMAPSLNPAQQHLAGQILALFLETRFLTPRKEDVHARIGGPEKAVGRLLSYLIQTERLLDLGEGVIMHAEIVEESRQILLSYFRKNKSLDPGAFKGLIDSTRKYAIPLLEYWDRKGLTRRTGNSRTLREAN